MSGQKQSDTIVTKSWFLLLLNIRTEGRILEGPGLGLNDTVRGFAECDFFFSGTLNTKGRGDSITLYVSEKPLDINFPGNFYVGDLNYR